MAPAAQAKAKEEAAPSELHSAQKRQQSVMRQLGRSGLERRKREAQRERSQRYAMFAQEFGDVFEQLYDEKHRTS